MYIYSLLTWPNENKCCCYIFHFLLVYFVYQIVYYIFFSVHFLHAFFLPSVSCECCVWHIGRPGSRYWQFLLLICMISQLRLEYVNSHVCLSFVLCVSSSRFRCDRCLRACYALFLVWLHIHPHIHNMRCYRQRKYFYIKNIL